MLPQTLSLFEYWTDWLIDFNNISTCMGLHYTWRNSCFFFFIKMTLSKKNGRAYSSVYKLGLEPCYFFFSFEGFSHQLTLMVFHWSLSNSKSPQFFRTLPIILANLNHAVVCMISTRPLISISSALVPNFLYF